MDTARGLAPPRAAPTREESDPTEGGVGLDPLGIGTDERRMHVRAYNYWVSLLKGRIFPAILDLDPGNVPDFGPHGVLLDFTDGLDDPKIRFLGRALRHECALDHSVERIAQVPARSLLSRLTDHYLQIIANRAPVGFEAEFVGTRGHPTMYRGILMPFSSDGVTIDFVYGVINWKEMVDAAMQAGLETELAAAVRAIPRPDPVPVPAVWADGPSVGTGADPSAASLADTLALARESAAAVRAADTRGRAALYRALGRAHDFVLAAQACPDAYATLLAEAGIKPQARAPMTPATKLVFGTEYDKTRLTEYAAVLNAAARHRVGAGGLAAFLERSEGGIKGLVAEERATRRPGTSTPIACDHVPLLQIALPADAAPGALVLMLGRVVPDGGIDVLGTVPEDAAMLRRAVRMLR